VVVGCVKVPPMKVAINSQNANKEFNETHRQRKPIEK
jgi:hypothetical protein